MKIGLDLHGVISDQPEFFKQLMRLLRNQSWEVHIITGGSIEKAEQELKKLDIVQGYEYTHLFSVLDYHIEKGTRIVGWHPTLLNPEFPNEEWDRTKADYCRKHNIGLHLDDSMVYEKTFTTPFARVWTNTNTPKQGKPERLIK